MSVKISCSIIFNECRSSCRCATENIPLNTRMTHKPNLIAVICFGTAPSTEMKYEKEWKKTRTKNEQKQMGCQLKRWADGMPTFTMHIHVKKIGSLCSLLYIVWSFLFLKIFLQRFHVRFCYWLALLHDCKWQRL